MNTPHTWSDSPIHDELAAWELLKEARRERDEAREYADRLAEGLPDGMLPKDVEVLREANLGLATELAAVTEQRDKIEKNIRIELRGHPDSELWGDAGLIAATMRCVDALDTVTDQRDKWKAKYIQQNKDLGHELRDPNGTIWSECKRLQTELATVTEQRDEARKETIRTREFMDHGFAKARDELTAVTEQRDRLAEALANLVKANETWNQGMMDVIGRPPNWNDSYFNEAKEALQSLTPKS